MAENTHSEHHVSIPHIDGSELSLIWAIPFVGILLSIAIFPLILPRIWHKHFGKISAFWAGLFILPFTFSFGVQLALYEALHVLLLEYIPFIILLLSLYTVSGGVRISGSLKGTPLVNTSILTIGTIIASWMGTTGAAMLLIRPLLRAIENRTHQTHTVVFFIFLVANIGGGLSPLGDPPLFLGFLKGIDFFWPTIHMFLPTLFMSVCLLVIYYCIDRFFFIKEDSDQIQETEPPKPIAIEGKINLLLILGVVGAVLLSGVWKSGINIHLYHIDVPLQNITRDILLLFIAFLSLKLTSKEKRVENGFTWFPILEVGKLFICIFLTIIPAIAILKAGKDGALGGIIDLVFHEGEPANAMFFWLTGILSSFLDNAPTYLVFFNTAGGDPATLMGPLSGTLLAISAGAVFMGAMTYIGNAPNFMVRSIATEFGIKMPSFFGYMIWSVLFLGPLLLVMSYIFF